MGGMTGSTISTGKPKPATCSAAGAITGITKTRMKSITVNSTAKTKVVFHVNKVERYKVMRTAKTTPKALNKNGNHAGVGLKTKNTIMNKAGGNTARYHLPPDLAALSSNSKAAKAKTARPHAAKPP